MDGKVLYVAGLAHCGSTFTTRILNQHEDIFSVGELIDIFEMAEKDHINCGCTMDTTGSASCEFWSRVWERAETANLDLERVARLSLDRRVEWVKALTGMYQRDGQTSFAQLNREFFQILFEETGAEVIVDCSKSPWRMLPLMEALGDDLYVLYLYRSPHNQIASRVEKGYNFWHSAIMKYVRKNLVFRQMLRNFPNTLRIQYEQFVDHPDRHITTILDWLDIPEEDLFDKPQQPFHHLQGYTISKEGEELQRPDPEMPRKDMTFSPLQSKFVSFLEWVVS